MLLTLLSLSRLNHWLPRAHAYPEVMQGNVTSRSPSPHRGRPPSRGGCDLSQCDSASHGFVKLLRLRRSSGKRVPLPGPTHPLGGPLRTCNFSPTLESLPHLFAVPGRGQQMPSWSKVLGNGTIRRQKTLGMTCGLEPLHAILPLARRPMRVLTPVIEIATLAMFHPRGESRASPRRSSSAYP